jgi:hypothetical protein
MGGGVILPEFIYPGATVRVMDWVGVVLRIDGNLVTLESPKRVVNMQASLDVLDYALAPQLWQPATVDELIADAVAQREELNRAKRRQSRGRTKKKAIKADKTTSPSMY